MEQVLERAMEQGLEQGRELGIMQGIVNVAKKMILRNDDFFQISEITGLSPQKLNELKAELNNEQTDLAAAIGSP